MGGVEGVKRGWGVKCGVKSVDCKVKSVEVRSVKCGGVKSKVWSGQCGVHKCKV